MKIFLGSSREALDQLRHVASWLEEAGHEPVPWDDPELFLPGESTFEKLIQISTEVDAAVFIFGEDDSVWYRRDALNQPRDNVLVEYGLFSGALGQRKVIICRSGQSKLPTDTGGITYVGLDMSQRARISIRAWARSVSPSGGPASGAGVALAIDKAMLRRELDETRDRLAFEQQKSSDLQSLATRLGFVDFDTYDGIEGAWKLLFDYDYFWSLTRLLEGFAEDPGTFRNFLDDVDLAKVAREVSWDQVMNRSRTRVYIAKVLRLIRMAEVGDGTAQLNAMFTAPEPWPTLADQATALAKQRTRAPSFSAADTE